jgi:NitT/TauT family transport system ATP-binding protein
VFQSYSLFPWRTVSENVAFGLEIARRPKSEIRQKVARYLDVVNLAKWADSRPSQLSGGMRQRVAIARSLATEPEVLLLDEPFGALDAHTRAQMQDFLLSVWQRTGTTILMVTHDVEEALFLSQRIYVLSSHPGRIRREIAVPFPDERQRAIRRDERFLDLRTRSRPCSWRRWLRCSSRSGTGPPQGETNRQSAKDAKTNKEDLRQVPPGSPRGPRMFGADFQGREG